MPGQIPQNAPNAENMVQSKDVPSMTPGRAALIVLIRQCLSGLLDPFISLLEIHKLMYFLSQRVKSISQLTVLWPRDGCLNCPDLILKTGSAHLIGVEEVLDFVRAAVPKECHH